MYKLLIVIRFVFSLNELMQKENVKKTEKSFNMQRGIETFDYMLNLPH